MMAQFVDLCILCGCDYCPSIRGIGPTTALKLIKRHKDLEGVLKALDPAKYPLPDVFPHEAAAAFFHSPEVTPAENLPPLRWGMPDEDGIVAMLCGEHGFSEERVRSGVARILKGQAKSTQGRLESYFGPVSVLKAAGSTAVAAAAKGGKQPGKPKGKLGGLGGPAKGKVAKKK